MQPALQSSAKQRRQSDHAAMMRPFCTQEGHALQQGSGYGGHRAYTPWQAESEHLLRSTLRPLCAYLPDAPP